MFFGRPSKHPHALGLLKSGMPLGAARTSNLSLVERNKSISDMTIQASPRPAKSMKILDLCRKKDVDTNERAPDRGS